MRRAPWVLIAFVLLVPTRADAACGVKPARAEYETPEVQVYARGSKLLACHRATRRERQVGVRVNDGMGTDESSYVSGIVGRRWLWTTMHASFAESPDVREDTLTDLRTGDSVTVGNEEADVVALPGMLVFASDEGVTAHFSDRRPVERLSAEPASHPAGAGARLYWTEGTTVARTRVFTLPAGDPPRPRPLARTVGRCAPRRGARLILRDGNLVVSRAAGATWACRGTKQRRVSDSPEVTALTPRHLLHPGGVFSVSDGRRRTLEGAEPATDLTTRYWLDGAGVPQRADF
ncbi:hypothetical protein [Solirubrobacter deserti]|uniref:Uncharacterized protein n=1 Tax=Solirubrobacter deserti TaxID=2282478 RepID=A0ABT4REP6_9ACTN|nr:hypothetical protein [Solirubrobacter deserti]MDA0137000.1 hypothetical protein [Solirubrobacter deserti]